MLNAMNKEGIVEIASDKKFAHAENTVTDILPQPFLVM